MESDYPSAQNGTGTSASLAENVITQCPCYDLLLLGSGTMFLRPEAIHKHRSLDTVDIDRLQDLLIK